MRVSTTDNINSDLKSNQGIRKYGRQFLKAGLFGLAFFSTGLMALPHSGQGQAVFAAPGVNSAPTSSDVEKSRDEELLDQLRSTMRANMNTIKFIRNDGQWSEEILYKGISKTGQVNVTSTGLKFVTPQNTMVDGQAEKGFHAWSLSFKNSSGIKGVVANDPAKVLTSYHGKSKSVTGAPSMHELLLQQVYPGIDLRLYSREAGKLEFDWVIAPGVDYRQIQLEIDGVKDLDVSNPDMLSIALHSSTVDMHIPESYQVDGDNKITVEAHYEQLSENLLAYNVVGEINPDLPLVIDPELSWGTWFDGSHTPYNVPAGYTSGFDQYLNAIDVAPCSDQNGNSYERCVYAAGTTNIDVDIADPGYITYPTSNGVTPFMVNATAGVNLASNTDAVVYVLDEDGQNILYATHFGGEDHEKGYGIAVSPAGGTVFLSGYTESDAQFEGFPVTNGTTLGEAAALLTEKVGGSADGYVAAFDITLSTLKYSTYIGTGGAGDVSGFAISETMTTVRAISDSSYVVGGTVGAGFGANQSIFISANAPDPVYNPNVGGTDPEDDYAQYIAQFSNFNNLDFGTYVDGSWFDQNNDTIILDNGYIAFAGVTQCTGESCGDEGFPALVNDVGAEVASCPGGAIETQSVVGVVNPANTSNAFEMLSRIGGCDLDGFYGLKELATGDLYVGGNTGAADHPLNPGNDVSYVPYQGTKSGGLDGIVGYLPPTGGAGNWHATFLGGGANDIVNSVAGFFDGVFLYGTTDSDGTPAPVFPTLNVGNGSFFSDTHGGGNGSTPKDIFFTALSLDLEDLVFSTLVGGDENDYLGDTGNPRGSNHIFADDSYLWLGTTVHSDSDTIQPSVISTAAGGFDNDSFDINKSNATSNGPDSHLIFRIGRVGTNIQLVKDVTNSFNGTSQPGDFTLTVQGNDGTHDTALEYVSGDAAAIDPNFTYVINEIDEEFVGVGYTKTGITCVNDDGGATVGSALGDGSYQIPDTDISLGDNITCTISNQDNNNPEITLVKTGTGPLTAGGQGFDYNAVGDTLNYSYLVTNVGDVNLPGPVTIDDDKTTDELCPSLTTVGNGDTVFNVGEQITCSSTHTVIQGDIDDGEVVNIATASAGGVDSNEDTETLLPELLPEIELLKTGTLNDGGDGVVDVGDTITYQFTVTNNGNVTLNPVTVVDQNPLVVVSGGPISLAPGISDSTTFTGTYSILQGDIDAGGFRNVADTFGQCVSTTLCPVTDDDDDIQQFPQVPSISIVKTGTFDHGGNNVADVGELINYTLTVTNTGNTTLAPVTVTDTIIADADIICPGATPSNVIASMLPDDVVVCTGSYAVTQPDIEAGNKYNQATATGTCPQTVDPTNCPATDTDDHDQPLPRAPGISLVKSGTVSDTDAIPGINAGDTIAYTFEITNTGNLDLTNVTLLDAIITGGFTCPGGHPIASMPVGGPAVTCTADYTVTIQDMNFGSRPNTATATGQCVLAQPDCPVVASDDNVVPLPRTPAIQIVKDGSLAPTGQNGTAVVGDIISYTFAVTNTGNIDLTSVDVTDPLPGLSAIVCPSGNPIPTLAPGATENCTATYAITQPDITAGNRNNTATATGECTAIVCPISDSDDHDEPMIQGPEISILKTGSFDAGQDGLANPGELITYNFAVTNTGNIPLTTVTISDTVVGTITCTNGYPISPLNVGITENCSATYAVDQDDIDAGFKDNIATATGQCSGSNLCPVSDDDDHEEPLPTTPDIELIKDGALDLGADGVATVGDLINYTFTVTNIGNQTLYNVEVTDPKIANITCPAGNPFGPMAPNEVVVCNGSLAIDQADIQAGEVLNQARVVGECPPLQTGCTVEDIDDHREPVSQDPDIQIIKDGAVNAGNDGMVGPGDTIGYTFDVTNTGNLELTSVLVSDPLVTSIACAGGSNPIALLAVGASEQCTGSYTILEADILAGHRANVATVTGQCVDQANCPTEDDDDHDEPLPHIDLAKTAGAPTLMPDGTYNVEYTVTASNSGQADGIYNIMDTFAPATGLALNGNPTIAFGSGEGQSGSIGTYPALLSNEMLAAGASESWTITANFTADPTADLTDARACTPGAAVTGMGFFNHVEGSASDTVPANNDACTNLPEAEMDLAKTIDRVEFTGVNEQTVTYIITATNTGEGPAVYDVVDSLDPGDGITAQGPATVTYVAIDDNFASPVTNPPGWPTISTAETISGLSSESWQVVVVFSIDTTNAGFDATKECQREAIGWVAGRGFYNGVDAIAGEIDLSNNEVCATPALAYLSIVKVIEDPNGGGTLTPADFPITLTGADGVHDSGVEYFNGDNPDVTVGVSYTVSELNVDPDYTLESIVCEDDANANSFGDTVTLVDGQSVTCTVTNVYKELLIDSLAEVCINDVPYVSYDVTTIGVDPVPTEVEVRFYSDGGNGSTNPADYTTLVETLTTRPLSGQELWPGATVDQNGNGLTWPGWQEQPNGTWIEVDDGLVPSLLMVFEVNPISQQIVNYPPRTANCVPPSAPPPNPPTIPVPVNSPLAIILMILSMLGMGWYFRPSRER